MSKNIFVNPENLEIKLVIYKKFRFSEEKYKNIKINEVRIKIIFK
jgi:hypothetical protein